MSFVLGTEKRSGGQTLLHWIALLAIAAPRRVIAFAVLLTVALGDIRGSRSEKPVRQWIPGSDLRIGRGDSRS